MKSVQHFPGQMNGFLSRDFGSVRHRISAATSPYTSRKLSRKPCRIPSLNRKGGRLFLGIAMTCAMSQKYRLLQSFLTTFLNWGVA